MKLNELVSLLNAEVFTKDNYDGEKELNFAFASDLMSDALMLLRSAADEFFEQGLLITGLVTRQSVRTAEMLDFGVVLLVRGKKPNDNVYEAAEEANIILLGTECSMLETCGRMYQKGIRGVSK